MAVRHALYFGVPLALLAVGISQVRADPLRHPHGRRTQVVALLQQGRVEESVREAEAILAAMDAQLAVERKMIDIRPTASHLAYAAELIYQRSMVQALDIDPHRPGDPKERLERIRAEKLEAIAVLEEAARLGGIYANRGFPELDEAGVRERLAHWRYEAGIGPRPTASAATALTAH
jgi:hypothetical protein